MSTPLSVNVVRAGKQLLKRDAVVFFSFEGEKELLLPGEVKILGASATRAIRQFAKKRQYASREKEMIYLPGGKAMIVLVGLGRRRTFEADVLRKSASAVLKLTQTLKVKRVGVVLPIIPNTMPHELVPAAAEGCVLGNYDFDKYKTTQDSSRLSTHIELAVEGDETQCRRALRRTLTVTDSVVMARDLVNDNSDEVHPEAFVEAARQAVRGLPIQVTVLNDREILKKGLHLLHAVGRASKFPPRLMMLEYTGDPTSKERIALVGKGVTFDTGGVNLKPSDRGFLEDMHMDMSGAATVLATIKVAAELKLPRNLLSVMPLAENAIDGHSYKPGSVLRAYNGKSVEIKNTDAEGRLILADAISYIVKNKRPTHIIDVATLTGHCIIALGEYVAGLFSNNDPLANALFEAGERSRERVWRMPLYNEYCEEVKGLKGDLQNSGKTLGGLSGGAITAAAFLKEFVGKTPWAHIDVAGPAMSTGRRDYIPKGGTGFGVRLLIEYLTAR